VNINLATQRTKPCQIDNFLLSVSFIHLVLHTLSKYFILCNLYVGRAFQLHAPMWVLSLGRTEPPNQTANRPGPFQTDSISVAILCFEVCYQKLWKSRVCIGMLKLK